MMNPIFHTYDAKITKRWKEINNAKEPINVNFRNELDLFLLIYKTAFC